MKRNYRIDGLAPPRWRARFAPHLSLTALDRPTFHRTVGTADPLAQIDHIAGLGFAGVQDNLLKLRPASVQAAIGAALARHGLAMGSFVGHLETWNRPLYGSEDPDTYSVLLAELEGAIAAAHRTGGRHVTVTAGCDPAVPRVRQFAAMVEKLKRLADVAASGGVVLTIETVSDHLIPGMLVSHLADALAIVRAVEHPAVRLVFDTGHIEEMDGDLIGNFQRCHAYVAAVQLADQPHRGPVGSGRIDFPALLRVILDSGYDGLLELEHLPASDDASHEALLLDAARRLDAVL